VKQAREEEGSFSGISARAFSEVLAKKEKPPAAWLNQAAGASQFRILPAGRENLLEYGVFQHLGWAQADNRLGFDLDLFASLRIAADARLAVCFYDAADSGNDKLSRGAFGFLNGELVQFFKKGRNGLLRCAQLLGHV